MKNYASRFAAGLLALNFASATQADAGGPKPLSPDTAQTMRSLSLACLNPSDVAGANQCLRETARQLFDYSAEYRRQIMIPGDFDRFEADEAIQQQCNRLKEWQDIAAPLGDSWKQTLMGMMNCASAMVGAETKFRALPDNRKLRALSDHVTTLARLPIS